MDLAESVKVDQACRQQGTAFIRAELHGVFGSVFCDFGNTFTVLDVDGVCIYGSPCNLFDANVREGHLVHPICDRLLLTPSNRLHAAQWYVHAGEEPITGIVSGVTQSESSTIISCVEDERLEFQVCWSPAIVTGGSLPSAQSFR